MPDREKVRKTLIGISFALDMDGHHNDAQAVRDALALLKEQEPKMVVKTTSTIRCPGCGKQITNKGAIHRDIKYCWKCGQAIMWEPPKEED